MPTKELNVENVNNTTPNVSQTEQTLSNTDTTPPVDNKEMGYIQGYEKASGRVLYPGQANDPSNKTGTAGPIVVFDPPQNKPTHDYAGDRIRRQYMPTRDEETFKYSVANDNDFEFEDPTYLGYDVKIEMSSSPLFNYGMGMDTPANDGNGRNLASPLSFIRSYSVIDEIAKRETIWKEFVIQILKIFDTDLTRDVPNKSYNIESISGLEKLTNKMVEKYEEDKITIALVEDVSLRATYITELYNNLIYSYKNQRYLIPINCLRFDLVIRISDIRTFKLPGPDGYVNNTTPSYTLYKLHDCNFDFFNSKPHEDVLSVGGFGKHDAEPKSVKFDITYKSVSREFRSPLIYNSLAIANKQTAILNPGQYTKGDMNATFPNSKSQETIDRDEQNRKNADAGNIKQTDVKSSASSALGNLKSGNIATAAGAISAGGGLVDSLGGIDISSLGGGGEGGSIGGLAGDLLGGNLSSLGGVVNNYSSVSELSSNIFGDKVDSLKRGTLINETLFKVSNYVSEKIPYVGDKLGNFINEIDTTKIVNQIGGGIDELTGGLGDSVGSLFSSGVLKNIDVGALADDKVNKVPLDLPTEKGKSSTKS